MAAMRFLRHYLLAVQFFTRIPITGRLADWVGFSPALLRASAGHFPGVGALLGALMALAAALGFMALPPLGSGTLVVAVGVTALGALLTGAFHEDGLADLADGLGGSADRLRALEIMKDSRIGSFGALALVLVVLFKVALLALLGDVSAELMCGVLWLAQVVSRTWPLLTIRLLRHVGDEAGSKSKPLADQISPASLGTGLVWCAGAVVLAGYALINSELSDLDLTPWGQLRGLGVALLVSGMAWGVVTQRLWHRLSGFTGDGLGATQQVCELAFYLGWCVCL
jgi:adenosylcobinamide-GDP ribazoletransferase